MRSSPRGWPAREGWAGGAVFLGVLTFTANPRATGRAAAINLQSHCFRSASVSPIDIITIIQSFKNMHKPFHISRRTFLARCTATAAATGLPLWFVQTQLATAADAVTNAPAH